MSNGLDQDKDRKFVSPDLGPKCLQRLSAASESFVFIEIIQLNWLENKSEFVQDKG